MVSVVLMLATRRMDPIKALLQHLTLIGVITLLSHLGRLFVTLDRPCKKRDLKR